MNNKICICFLFLTTLFYCSCKETTLDLLEGIYLANIPDGEFLLVVPQKGDAYCVVCRNNTIDSISVTLEKGTIKDASGITIAKLSEEDGVISASIPSMTDEIITTEFIHHDFIPTDKSVTPKHPIRYLEPITEDTIQPHKNIFYTRVAGFYSSNSVGDIPISDIETYIDSFLSKYKIVPEDIDLSMDVYFLENDTVSRRPLVILLHGGAFLFGDKGGTFMRHLAQHYATRGYVVASVNYRLGCSMFEFNTIRRMIYRAVQDADKAEHFLIDHADEYSIDPNAIFLVGHSAGAITALSATVLTDEDKYDGIDQFYLKDLGRLPNPVKLLGTVGLWGAITELHYINMADNPDFLLMHGTDDDIVPFREGIPFFNKFTMANIFKGYRLYGSGVIKEEMDRKGLPCELYLFPGMPHDPHLDEMGKFNDNINIVDSVTTSFLYRKLDKLCPMIEVSQGATYYRKNYRISRDTCIRKIAWIIQGGLVFRKSSNNEIECYMFSNAPSSKVTATVMLTNGHIVTQETE